VSNWLLFDNSPNKPRPQYEYTLCVDTPPVLAVDMVTVKAGSIRNALAVLRKYFLFGEVRSVERKVVE
jgi:hypothetical protein